MAPSSPSSDELLTVDEIARILKLNPQTVRNWIDQAYLRAIRIGRSVRVTRAEFDRLIDESYTGRSAEPNPTMSSRFTADAFWSGEPHPGPELPLSAPPGHVDRGSSPARDETAPGGLAPNPSS